MIGLGAAAFAGCAGRRPAEVVVNDNVALDGPAAWLAELRDLLVEHVRRYPRMEPSDLYKLLMQRSMGPEHMVHAGEALAWLQREAAELAPLPSGVDDVAVELLDPSAGLARIHLRPWLAQGRALEALADAFAATAARWTPNPDRLAFELGAARGLLPALGLPLGFDAAAWEAFMAPLVAQGLPAVHHSETYRAAYAPAYRVVLVRLLADGGGGGGA